MRKLRFLRFKNIFKNLFFDQKSTFLFLDFYVFRKSDFCDFKIFSKIYKKVKNQNFIFNKKYKINFLEITQKIKVYFFSKNTKLILRQKENEIFRFKKYFQKFVKYSKTKNLFSCKNQNLFSYLFRGLKKTKKTPFKRYLGRFFSVNLIYWFLKNFQKHTFYVKTKISFLYKNHISLFGVKPYFIFSLLMPRKIIS